MKKKIKVVLSAIWYPMTMATWFWRAFERRKDIDLQVVGPFTGDWIPWMYGIHLPQKYVRVPDVPLPKETIGQRIPSSVVEHQLPWIPDIFIQIDAGWHFVNKPNAGVVVLVETDPHVLKPQYELPKSYSDITFCMQQQYMHPGEIYLPYAYDPTVHYPMPEVEKIYDACLIGLQYPSRNNLVSRLQSHGMKVKYGTGEIFDEYRLAYNQSKVALSWSTLEDIPARVFEAMGMGIPLIANHVPDMDRFFTAGIDYLAFSSLDDGNRLAMEAIKNEELRAKLREASLETIKPHTWDNRVKQILEEAKLI